MTNTSVFRRPEESEIIKRLVEKNPNNTHPRLFVRSEDWERIRNTIKTDKDAKEWFESVKAFADEQLFKEPYEFVIENPGGILNPIQKRITPRMEALSFMWQVTRNEEYAKRAYLEMEAVCKFPSWVPCQYLEVGQMLYTMSLAYDWIYDWMSSEQREYIKDSIVEKGLDRFKKSYEVFWSGREPLDPFGGDAESWWTRLESNWNPWVNGGVIGACLAIGDEEPEMCGYYLRSALASLELCLDALAPDGASVEGIGYGNISTIKFTYLIACMDSALGTDYGYFDASGFSGFTAFLNHMNGPVTSFTYHDSGICNNRSFFQNAFFVANRNNDYAPAKIRLSAIREKLVEASLFDILWYRPGVYEDADTSTTLDSYFKKAETGSMRSSFDDKNAMWLAFHGGNNNVTHAHLDSGTFVFDAMGENWALDMGTEPLTYDSNQPFDDRWLLYRICPSGHNTIQINRNDEYGQLVESFAPVTKFESRPEGCFAIMDLTDAYRFVASSMKRGFGLLDNRRCAIVQDEIKLKEKGDIWWSMHTSAEIEIAGNGRTVYLMRNGKTMKVSVQVAENARIYSMKAEPLEGMPRNPYETVNNGVNKLCINIPDAKEANIRVEFIPVYGSDDMEKKQLGFELLDNWQVTEKN